jgi:hypothetical protein
LRQAWTEAPAGNQRRS